MQQTMIRLIIAISAFFLLAACNSNDATKPTEKVGIINEEKIYMESEPAKAAVKHLDSISAKLHPELMKMQADMEKKPNDKNLQETMNKRFFEMQQIFGTEQQQVTNKVDNVYKATREEFIKKEGISIILSSDQVIEYSPSVDITDKIIEKMNKVAIDFTTPTEAVETKTPATASNSTIPDNAKKVAASNSTTPDNTKAPAASNSTADSKVSAQENSTPKTSVNATTSATNSTVR